MMKTLFCAGLFIVLLDTVKTEAGCLPQTSVNTYQIMRRHIARETSDITKIIAEGISCRSGPRGSVKGKVVPVLN
jgi:hypothetical protein